MPTPTTENSSDQLLGLIDYIARMGITELALVEMACQQRRKRLRASNPLRVGDRVRLTSCKPQYLEGTLATVVEKKQVKFLIELDENVDPRAIQRFRGRRIVAPPTILEKVEV